MTPPGLLSLKGSHAIVTGGGSGIGLAIARRLCADGAAVTVMGRNRDKLAAAADAISATPIVCDVTDPASVERAFAQACAESPCDILINNAGAASSRGFAKTSLEEWRAMLNVNLTGVFLCTQAMIHAMSDMEYGRIINVASTAGLKGYPYVSAYVAAKHGVIGLTRALALELASSGVTVNAVCPGFTETDLVERSLEKISESTGRSREEAVQEFVKYNPQGRLVRPIEVANAVSWLCSHEAAAITGQSICVAGGEIM